MTARPDDLFAELGRLAHEVGPAFAPVGHEELLRSITETARELFDAAACSLALLDDSGEELVFHVASGAGAEDVAGLRIPASRGIAGWVVMSGQAIAIEDVTQDPRFAHDIATQTGYVPRSILAMPLETDRRMLGVIEVLDRRVDVTRTRDMELLGLFARQAALAIEGARVFAELGTELLRAAAAAAGDGELGRALERAAEDTQSSRPELAELAAVFCELGRLGDTERTAAIRLVRDFLDYARRRQA
jgi:GAF domain-containing protein